VQRNFPVSYFSGQANRDFPGLQSAREIQSRRNSSWEDFPRSHSAIAQSSGVNTSISGSQNWVQRNFPVSYFSEQDNRDSPGLQSAREIQSSDIFQSFSHRVSNPQYQSESVLQRNESESGRRNSSWIRHSINRNPRVLGYQTLDLIEPQTELAPGQRFIIQYAIETILQSRRNCIWDISSRYVLRRQILDLIETRTELSWGQRIIVSNSVDAILARCDS
jgi:hypothetical protein